MPKYLVPLALLALAACRADFEPDLVGPVTPPPAPAPAVAVPFRLGSTQPDEARAIAVGSGGDLLVASWFVASVDFDPGPAATIRTGLGLQDLAVASYSTAGALRWLFTYGGSGADIPFAIAATADGGVVVTGHSTGGGTCAGRTLVGLGGRDILVMKISNAGTCEWAHLIGSSGDDEGRAVAVETGGTVLVAGLFNGTVDFDPGTEARLVPSRGGNDAFLLRLGSDGSFLNVIQGGGLGEDAFTAVSVANSGDISVGGTFTGEASYGSPLAPVILQTQGMSAGVLARLTPLLGLRWAAPLTGTGEVLVAGLSEDVDGTVLVTGSFTGTIDADPGTGALLLQAEGGTDLFVARYEGNAGGFANMARRVGGPGSDVATAITRSADGTIHLAGWFQSTVDFDPGAGASLVTARGTGGAGDAFLLALTSLGSFQWVTPIGAFVTGDDALAIPWGVARVAGGGLWTVGRFSGRADFDPGTLAVELQSVGATDQFVSQYDPATGALLPLE
ncbi:MAG: hypothetical protein SFU57_12640 [Gemmatimonadales bacterium]|nr:hypothetical protein [Gemmatimonadales bacterium]